MFSRTFNLRSAFTLKNVFIGAATFTLYNYYNNNFKLQDASCCGIVGILSTKPIACEYCV